MSAHISYTLHVLLVWYSTIHLLLCVMDGPVIKHHHFRIFLASSHCIDAEGGKMLHTRSSQTHSSTFSEVKVAVPTTC